MTPTPGTVLVAVTLSVLGGILVVAASIAVARCVAALALAEDAKLPAESKQRARELFLSKLTDRQRRDWLLLRRFTVTAASGRRYTIANYRPFNISARDAVFCIQVTSVVPVYDKLLAQKLLIEADEELFLARANVRAFSNAWGPLMTLARARYPAG